MTVKLGDKAKDRITGLVGTIVSTHQYLNGCVRVGLQPAEVKDGKPVECTHFDIEQIELVQADQHPVLKATGGPEATPPARATPSR